jgi:peroxiredoxin
MHQVHQRRASTFRHEQLAGGSTKQPATPASKPGFLGPGTQAPDFALHATPDQVLRLSELRGRPVILAFYPADWSAVCGDQLALYNEILPEFRAYGADLIGISVDGVWCHAAFARDRHLHFSLLSDFEPKGAVSRLYGAYREQDGTCERALFVLDADGIIRWSYCSPVAVNPGADGILNALESFATRTEEADDEASADASVKPATANETSASKSTEARV